MVAASWSSSSAAATAGYALAATAMALSGTLVLLSICRAKPNPAEAGATHTSSRLRPCLSSFEKRKREKAQRGSKKRVRFADDVVDNGGGPAHAARDEPMSCVSVPAVQLRTAAMPANREALYRGMLRGRSVRRISCSY